MKTISVGKVQVIAEESSMANPQEKARRTLSRRDFLKVTGVAGGCLIAGGFLEACSRAIGQDPPAIPVEPKPITSTNNPPAPAALEFVPAPTKGGTEFPSVVEGLYVGEVAPGNTLGMIPGYESTGINTIYNPEDPIQTYNTTNGEIQAIPPRAFGIDQDQLKTIFRATEQDGVFVGTYKGSTVTLQNGVWTAATGEKFIPFIKAEPGTDAVYLVMDVDGQIQKVDITGKAIGSPYPMFEQPADIAKRMGFEKADQVVDVEMNKNGSLSFITKEARPTEKNPDRTVQIVNEVAFLGEPEKLEETAAAKIAIADLAGAPAIAGTAPIAEGIKNKGFTVRRIEGLDPTDPTGQTKKNYYVATVTVDDAKVGGDLPLMIKGENGWEELTGENTKGITGLDLSVFMGGYGARDYYNSLIEAQGKYFVGGSFFYSWGQNSNEDINNIPRNDDYQLAVKNKKKHGGKIFIHPMIWEPDMPENVKKLRGEALSTALLNHVKYVVAAFPKSTMFNLNEIDSQFLEKIGSLDQQKKFMSDLRSLIKETSETGVDSHPERKLVWSDTFNHGNSQDINGSNNRRMEYALDNFGEYIDVIGMELTIFTKYPPKDGNWESMLKDRIEFYRSRYGKPIAVTELNVNINSLTGPDRFITQAGIYEQLGNAIGFANKNNPGTVIFVTPLDIGDGICEYDRDPKTFAWNKNTPNNPTMFAAENNKIKRKLAWYYFLKGLLSSRLSENR